MTKTSPDPDYSGDAVLRRLYPWAYGQGLRPDVVDRLLRGTWTAGDYRQYLRTDYWKAKAAEKKLANRMCQICFRAIAQQIHHPPGLYGKILFREEVGHLLSVCARCHRKLPRK
jgi:hypothetical protein